MPAAQVDVAAERDFQYCTEVLVRGDRLPPANEVRAAMHAFGGSTVVAVTGDILKIHVHTDTPDAVFSYAARWGRVDTTKAEDMRAQHRRLAHAERRAVAVVTDSSADLPDPVLDRHRIALVPLQVVFGDVHLPGPGGAQARGVLPTAPRVAPSCPPRPSPPLPISFRRSAMPARRPTKSWRSCSAPAFRAPSQSAQAAVRAGGLKGVHLVDSRSASLGVGLLALRGAELAEAGWPAPRIAAELSRIRGQSGMLLTVDRYDNLLRSGRISRGKAWLAGMLDVKPILSLDLEGKVVPVERVRGRENVEARMLALLDQRLTPRPRRGPLRQWLMPTLPETAQRMQTALVRRYRPSRLLRHPGHGGAGHPRRAGSLGNLLSGRGRCRHPDREDGAGMIQDAPEIGRRRRSRPRRFAWPWTPYRI